MSLRFRRRPGVLLGALAAAGVLAAHAGAYLVAAPELHERAELLEATGHGHRIVVAIALGALVAVCSGLPVPPLRALGKLQGRELVTYAAPRLVVLQLVGFAGLEIAERAWAGVSISSTIAEPAVLAGFALQVVAALVGAVLLALAAVAVGKLSSLFAGGSKRAATAVPKPPPLLWTPVPGVADGGATLRGPPLHT